MVTFFVPVAGAEADIEVVADGAAEEADDGDVVAPSIGGAFVPHAVPTLAAIIAAAIRPVSILDFKSKFEFIL